VPVAELSESKERLIARETPSPVEKRDTERGCGGPPAPRTGPVESARFDKGVCFTGEERTPPKKEERTA